MIIRKLFQACQSYIGLGDNYMAQLNHECDFCKKMTAKKIQNSIPNQSSFYCSYCKHTYTKVDDVLGRKNRKKKRQASQAAVNQKIINKATTTAATTAADDSWEVKIDCVEACSKAPDTINIWFFPLAKRKVDTLMKEYSRR